MTEKKHTYTVVLPDGFKATRTTHRTYIGAIACKDAYDEWFALTWVGREDLVEAALGMARKKSYCREARLVRVEA